MTGRSVPSERRGIAIYEAPTWAPGPGAMYPRAVRLDHADTEGETLLATFECYATAGMDGTGEPYFPVFRSTDGGETWSRFSEIRDTQNSWGLRYQPVLFELPKQVGPWSRGTIIAAGNSIPEDRSRTKIDVYASTDHGRNWSYVSTVATGGRAVPQNGNTPVWEPEFAVDGDGRLVCYFADERHSDIGFDQLIGHRVSHDGGRTWAPQEFDVAISDDGARPGMPVVTKLPTDEYVMVYEIVSGGYQGGIYLKTSSNGRDWGAPDDSGVPVETAEGYQLMNGPYVTWAPADEEETVLLVSAKTLRDRDGSRAPKSGRTILANEALDGTGNWKRIPAPLWFEDELETDDSSIGWTSPLLSSQDVPVLAELTSTSGTDGALEIRYARNRIDFDPDW